MSRKLERNLLLVGSIWNLITSLLTMFSYNTWFHKEGTYQLDSVDINTMIVGTHLLENISKIILTFGLFMFVGSIINFLISIKIKDDIIQNKILIWIGFWGLVQLISMDIIGFVIFMVVFIIYLAKNKAIKLSGNVTN